MRLSLKHFFIFLITLILILFALNFFYSKNISVNEISNSQENRSKKTVGINIERNNLNGETIKITSKELDEDLKKKTIRLKYTVTKINRNGVDTVIKADVAVIKNYDEFEFDKNVEISNEQKKFLLKTDKLFGKFKKGSMYSENDVNIKISNINITGSGMKLLNYGDYIKIFGKAKLISRNYE